MLLIVDDDLRFTRTLLDAGHARGFKGLIALRGATALSLARKFKPAAVTLDIELPDLDGWKVLDALKHDPAHATYPSTSSRSTTASRRPWSLARWPG